MNSLFNHIQTLWRLPRRFRSAYIRNTMVVGGYKLVCKLKGKEFTFPSQTPPAGNYIITKYIPSIGIAIFGKRYIFTHEIPLERVPYTLELAQEISEKTKGPIRLQSIAYANPRETNNETK